MKTFLLFLLILIGIPLLVVFFSVLKFLVRFIYLLAFPQELLKPFGERAMARVPERIHLQKVEGHSWAEAGKIEDLTRQVLELGFAELGTYVIPENPDIHLRLFTHPDEITGACLYERPGARIWLDLYSDYENDDNFTATTLKDRGLKKPPGFRRIYDPQASPRDLFERFQKQRHPKGIRRMAPDTIVQLFEGVYGRARAWRNKEGITGKEVLNVLQTREKRKKPGQGV